MRIGIITFHWATNYGAVLQAYALQTYLCRMGHDAHIIDYVWTPPKRGAVLKLKAYIKKPSEIYFRAQLFRKELNFRKFRTDHLGLSTRKYVTVESLKSDPPIADAYICGSDQIWNSSLTRNLYQEGGLPYFLDFGSSDIYRIAFAASFGDITTTDDYPYLVREQLAECLSRFTALSVRERSGLNLVASLGFHNSCVMPDPALLLSVDDYLSLAHSRNRADFVFYTLPHERSIMIQAEIFARKRSKSVTRIDILSTIGIADWLGHIYSADFVVTNSFHGVVFSILFERPFVAVLFSGSAACMNDRVITLLGHLGLTDRILDTFDESNFLHLIERSIDWVQVKRALLVLRHEAYEFLYKSLAVIEPSIGK